MVLQAKCLSMRANTLTIPIRWAMNPPIQGMPMHLQIISHLGQMCNILREVEDFAEWSDAMQEVVLQGVCSIPPQGDALNEVKDEELR